MLGGVFISYRREDSGGYAGRIYDRLTSRLGRENVFFDVDAIPPGRDFVDVLSERVGKCDVLLAVIGKHWVASADGQNRRRLDDPNDFVRIEIEAALERNVPVIPVLVDGAPMPQPEELPESLKKLTRRQAVEISLTRFDSDAERLTDALSQIEDELRRRDAAGGEPPARTVGDEAERPAPERPTQAKAAASASAGASLAGGRTKPRSFVVLAILGLAIVAGVALLLARLGPHSDKTAGLIAPPTSPQPAAPTPAPASSALEPDQWLTLDDFRAEFNRKAAAGYQPDMVSGRCEDGVIKYQARWTQKSPGLLYAHLLGLFENDFNSRKTDLTSQGYALQYQNVFMGCEGRKRYLALWTKSE
jgi:TIR domain/Bacterial tandem repeat domain 1